MDSKGHLVKLELKGHLMKMDSKGQLVKLELKGHPIKTDPKGHPARKPRPFVKAPSQSHIQIKNSANMTVEHERKKLKKSRSFDKHSSIFEENRK